MWTILDKFNFEVVKWACATDQQLAHFCTYKRLSTNKFELELSHCSKLLTLLANKVEMFSFQLGKQIFLAGKLIEIQNAAIDGIEDLAGHLIIHDLLNEQPYIAYDYLNLQIDEKS